MVRSHRSPQLLFFQEIGLEAGDELLFPSGKDMLKLWRSISFALNFVGPVAQVARARP